MEPYQTNWDHLQHWMSWVQLVLEEQMAQQEQKSANPLFISPEEARDLLKPSDSAPSSLGTSQILEREIQAKTALTEKGGQVFLALPHLRKRFHLSTLELKILILCLAPEIALHYGKLYAYLQDDMTARLPAIFQIFRLLESVSTSREVLQECLFDTASLFQYRLLRKIPSLPLPHLHLPLKIDERVVQFLLAPSSIQTFSPLAQIRKKSLSWDEVFLPPQLVERLQKVALLENPVLYFRGGEYTGKEEAALALAQQLNQPLVRVKLPSLPLEKSQFEEVIWSIHREVVLQRGALYLEGLDDFLFKPDLDPYYKNTLRENLSQATYLVFLSGEQKHALMISEKMVLPFDFSLPPSFLQKQYWKSLLPLSSKVADSLSSTFSLSGPLIKRAIAEAHSFSLLEGKTGKISEKDLQKACIAQSHHNLTNLANQIQPFYGFDDLVLPPKSQEILQEVCLHIQYKDRVFGRWGFQDKYPDVGLAALFVGESGTGKTMAAQVIAREVGLDLFRIDLSRLVNKYIGETEKNLSKIFDEAERSHCILFFDEADAIFGKRSEVESAHDRYANIETDYLLQRMEKFSGVMVLASNFQENIDEAFLRRMRFLVEFPFPGKKERLKIWKKIFPKTAPLAKDVNFEFMADNFPVSGGNIRNIALNAAFLAAKKDKISMEDLIFSSRREYDKMGRRITKRDFGRYFSLLGVEEGS